MDTIWSKGAIPLEEWKYRHLKRVTLPVVDVLFITGGILGARNGIPAIDNIYPDWVADIGGYIFSFIGFLCLVGVAFPRLWLLEVWSKSAILAMTSGYFAALVVATFNGRPQSSYVMSMAGVTIAVVAWRLSVLSYEARERGAAK